MKKGLVILIVVFVSCLCGCSTALPEEEKEVIAPAVISTEEIQVKEEEPAPVQELQTVPEPEPVMPEPEPEQQPKPVQEETVENNSMDVADSMGCEEGFMANLTYEEVQAYINETNNPNVVSIASIPADYIYEDGNCFFRRPIDDNGTQSYEYECKYRIKDTNQKAMIYVACTSADSIAHFEGKIDVCRSIKKKYLRRFGNEDLYQYKLITDNMLYTHEDRPLWEEGGETTLLIVRLDDCIVYIEDPRITEENAVEFFQQFEFEKGKQ